ncbi:MAG: ADP-glyceromanno-heptose 6-epimerase [Bacteroidales bacterium]|jgi:ADP-L-glycero-D-manno-heptose 6-epimerase|nr:ADP-glyceromanno-heptose 6-epimerase [Bacteroidales bacterium]
MIVVTGAAGFIGSVVTGFLNEKNRRDLILVDDFSRADKKSNFSNKKYEQLIDRKEFVLWLELNYSNIEFIIHLGARTDTTEFNYSIFEELNVAYSKDIFAACTKFKIPLIYASSAATYGLGELGYHDDHEIVSQLKPLNPYGKSKNEFDKWVLAQDETPPFWAGLKFFNVYGPNEYHKGRMASVIFHAFNQIKERGEVRLFRSHRPDFEDGMQLRDFIYVMDVAAVIDFLMDVKPASGLYNLGTGKARAFYDLAVATFRALSIEPRISFIDTPIDIRDKYQYFTEAKMSKLIDVGFNTPFISLEGGVKDYVTNYLISGKTY